MIRNSKPGSGFRLLFLFFLHSLLMARCWAQAPLVVNGVADRGNYNSNSVTFIVPSTNGYIYSVRLDGVPVPTDVGVLVSRMDHHELLILRTNAATLAFTNRLIQFILEYPLYNTTEHGYPNWTPYPPVDATAGELAGAQLRILAPRDFVLGLEIPVVAWIEKPDGNPVRANALMSAPGHPSIRLFRGAGSGLLAATNPAGPLSYEASIPGLATNHVDPRLCRSALD